jgi:transposase
MLAPQEVHKMLAPQALGWGAKRISRELGCSRNTVREYLRRGGWRPMDVRARGSVLEPHRQWIAERLKQHRGNADVVCQDLAREFGVRVSNCRSTSAAPWRSWMSSRCASTCL